MPKANINNALTGYKKPTDNRRKRAEEATALMTGANYDSLEDKTKLDIKSIPLNKINPRKVNEFSVADITGLAESIKLYGLINPLSVIHHPDTDEYIISAGHRRFQAIQQLHDEDPNNPNYQYIDCCVYEITDDPFYLKMGLPYITKEQEEGIYKDSNLQNRQLSYTDVAHQIRYIIQRFDDPEYFERIKRQAQENGVRTYSSADRVRLITSVLSTQNYSGWSRETIRQFLKVKEAGREDLIDSIENEGMAVSAAYKEVVKEKNQTRNRRTNKLNGLKKIVAEFKEEAETRKYDLNEINEIKDCIRELEEILKKNMSDAEEDK